jgi:integrase
MNDISARSLLADPATRRALALKFVAHHLWDPARRETDPQHGMPADVAAALRERDVAQPGPACAVDREAATRKLGDLASVERAGGSVRLAEPALGAAAGLARQHATASAQEQARLTRDVLDRLLATCGSDRLADTRDLAILLLAFASGGRRRSEVARLRVEQLSEEPAVPLDPRDPKSPTGRA